jgi:hypothetical protein
MYPAKGPAAVQVGPVDQAEDLVALAVATLKAVQAPVVVIHRGVEALLLLKQG